MKICVSIVLCACLAAIASGSSTNRYSTHFKNSDGFTDQALLNTHPDWESRPYVFSEDASGQGLLVFASDYQYAICALTFSRDATTRNNKVIVSLDFRRSAVANQAENAFVFGISDASKKPEEQRLLVGARLCFFKNGDIFIGNRDITCRDGLRAPAIGTHDLIRATALIRKDEEPNRFEISIVLFNLTQNREIGTNTWFTEDEAVYTAPALKAGMHALDLKGVERIEIDRFSVEAVMDAGTLGLLPS